VKFSNVGSTPEVEILSVSHVPAPVPVIWMMSTSWPSANPAVELTEMYELPI
jgi:hypothetical protein